MAEAVLPEVRAVQRRIVATVRAGGVLNQDGLAMWRENHEPPMDRNGGGIMP